MTARSVKGGEAEAPDVSAPSLEGPGSGPDHNGFGRPGTGRPGGPILGLAAGSPLREGACREGAVRTIGASVCLTPTTRPRGASVYEDPAITVEALSRSRNPDLRFEPWRT